MPKIQMSKRADDRFVFSINIPTEIVEYHKLVKGDEWLFSSDGVKIVIVKSGESNG